MWLNNFVQATPVCAILFFLRQVPVAPDQNRSATMNAKSLFIRAPLRAIGFIFAQVGRLNRYTSEHREFLSSGFVCKKCQQTLMGKVVDR